ncbi:ribonuclease H family protein [Chryseobacterium salviniae]|uniref:Uncharacterized protein n=1 Tax=Chryseobacterium salviniae TaxID=3101750 RepID=A0ABU6HM89_9FLAO|nr:hypothetical protein [Chryseobacterium sp. T9W2-O]MEC3874175.1 hypothetical protein [Chryseobacterium sp. T9W2-O]
MPDFKYNGKIYYNPVQLVMEQIEFIGKVLFKSRPFEDGTNNIVEFLAIVHALAYCKQEKHKTSQFIQTAEMQ